MVSSAVNTSARRILSSKAKVFKRLTGKKYEFRTSGCRKAEDGHVSKLFCLLFVLFLLVLVKKDLYVEGTISTQMYIGTVPCVFVNNTGYPFQRQVVIQV